MLLIWFITGFIGSLLLCLFYTDFKYVSLLHICLSLMLSVFGLFVMLIAVIHVILKIIYKISAKLTEIKKLQLIQNNIIKLVKPVMLKLNSINVFNPF